MLPARREPLIKNSFLLTPRGPVIKLHNDIRLDH